MAVKTRDKEIQLPLRFPVNSIFQVTELSLFPKGAPTMIYVSLMMPLI